MKDTNPKVDFYFDNDAKWQKEIVKLRSIILDCGLTEKLKWGVPCYMYQTKNIVLIHKFKEYCAILFFKGALLKDPHKILIQQSEQVQAARQARFTNAKEIDQQKKILKEYIYEAISVEEAGLQIKYKKTNAYPIPEELQEQFDKDPSLKKAFKELTPGRQRGYLLFFASAKQSKTRTSRIEKNKQHIFNGKGLND